MRGGCGRRDLRKSHNIKGIRIGRRIRRISDERCDGRDIASVLESDAEAHVLTRHDRLDARTALGFVADARNRIVNGDSLTGKGCRTGCVGSRRIGARAVGETVAHIAGINPNCTAVNI